MSLLVERYASRPEELKKLDLERSLTPDWFRRESRIGYVFYVDRFAGNLRRVGERRDYLQELGVNYLHLETASDGLRIEPYGVLWITET